MGYSQNNIVIKNVNIITMINDSILLNRSVVIKDNRIFKILEGEIPKSFQHYKQIEAKGKFLIPGLFDMHMHFVSDDRIDRHYLKDEAFIPIAYGVTSARIMIGVPEHLELRELIKERDMIAPHLYVASPQITGISYTEKLNGQVVTNYKDAYKTVIDYKEQGYDFIKLTFDLNKEAYKGVIDASKKVGIKVIGHVSRDVTLIKSLENGQDVEHLDQYMDAIISDEAPSQMGLSAFGLFQSSSWKTVNYIDSVKLEGIIRKTIENDIWNTPTNFFFISSFATNRTDNELKNSPEWNWFSEGVRKELLKYRKSYWGTPQEEALRKKYIDIRSYIIRELFRRSGKILAGSDAPEWLNLYGIGIHRELQNFVEVVGLTPYEALITATVNPATYLGLKDQGKIQEGYVADMILLNKNPLEDIKNTVTIDGVFYQGAFLSNDYLKTKLKESIEPIKKAPCTCD